MLGFKLQYRTEDSTEIYWPIHSCWPRVTSRYSCSIPGKTPRTSQEVTLCGGLQLHEASSHQSVHSQLSHLLYVLVSRGCSKCSASSKEKQVEKNRRERCHLTSPTIKLSPSLCTWFFVHPSVTWVNVFPSHQKQNC